jgi:hypothetical protein
VVRWCFSINPDVNERSSEMNPRHWCAAAIVCAVLFNFSGADAMEQPLLVLRSKTGVDGINEIAFFNRFERPIDFRFNIAPEQNLTPIVRSSAGEVVSNGRPFGFARAPSREVSKVSVAIGERYSFEVRNLFETVPDEKQIPGTYYVRVRYEHNGVGWESNEIEVTIK